MLIPKPYFDHILFLAPTPPDPPYLTTYQISYALSLSLLKTNKQAKTKVKQRKLQTLFKKKISSEISLLTRVIPLRVFTYSLLRLIL